VVFFKENGVHLVPPLYI